MAFTLTQKVLFKHCDPAGLVFYPRYFEMINDTIEAFFDEVVGLPFSELHRQEAVPTVQIDTRFPAPSRHGDMLTLRLRPTRLGGSSLGLRFTAHAGDELRVEARSTLVLVDAGGKPKRWPDRLRQNIEPLIESEDRP